uniref:Protein kinase domain-containing protein n=2 Tax=Chrysotila carterae TaxID=13221 RepID=A0A7S4F059_CHRCT
MAENRGSAGLSNFATLSDVSNSFASGFGRQVRGLRNAKFLRVARSAAKSGAKRMLSLREHGAHLLDVLDCCDGVMVAPTKEQVYVVGRELGFGQTAIVYEGRKRVNGDICALKCFKSDELRNTPYAVDALRAEVEILRALPPHKNVVTLHDVLSTPSTVVLATQLVSHGDMLTPVENSGAYKEQHARRLFAQIIEGVEHLHQSGVAHRDLKLENMCFADAALERVKIIDFGAAAFLNNEGFNEACGTALYAAPEMIPWLMPSVGRGPMYNKEVDYWAIGISLYVMLSGEAPFDQDKSLERLLLEVREARVLFTAPIWKKISKDAIDLIQKMLHPKPSQRMSPTAARTHKWFSNTKLLNPKPPKPQRLRKPTPEENPEDLEVLAALNFMTIVFDPFGATTARGSAAVTGRLGDLRLLVTPEPGTAGLVAVYTVRMWGTEGAFVLPTRQYDTPIAVVGVQRTQLLRWVAGEAPLLPEKVRIPPGSMLEETLACFKPEAHNFHQFLRERGEVAPLTKGPTNSVASLLNARKGKRAQVDRLFLHPEPGLVGPQPVSPRTPPRSREKRYFDYLKQMCSADGWRRFSASIAKFFDTKEAGRTLQKCMGKVRDSAEQVSSQIAARASVINMNKAGSTVSHLSANDRRSAAAEL